VPYRLKPDRPLAAEIRRIADKQIALAIANLRAVGDPRSDRAVHDARRHVKKARAAVRLVRGSFDGEYAKANTVLCAVNRMLAPVADGEAVLLTLRRLAREHSARLPPAAVASIREELVRRSCEADRRAATDRILARAADRLKRLRADVRRWRIDGEGFRAVRPGLARTYRRARRARDRARARPTARREHRWRQQVKDHWLQVRLIADRCGGGLASCQDRLEALDGHLGELHNEWLLEALLAGDHRIPAADARRLAAVLRTDAAALRREARALGVELYDRRPRRFVRDVRALWKAASERPAAKAPLPCPRAA
jgi:hypothetical protein